MAKKTGLWSFGRRQFINGVIGAALYGIFSWTFHMFPLSFAGAINFHPEVAVLVFIGIAYGPWAGLMAGLIGAALGDSLAGWGAHWSRMLAGGILGIISGLALTRIEDFRSQRGILTGIGFGALGVLVSVLFYALTARLPAPIDLNAVVWRYFIPDVVGDLIITVVLLPALMWALQPRVAKQASQQGA